SICIVMNGVALQTRYYRMDQLVEANRSRTVMSRLIVNSELLVVSNSTVVLGCHHSEWDTVRVSEPVKETNNRLKLRCAPRTMGCTIVLGLDRNSPPTGIVLRIDDLIRTAELIDSAVVEDLKRSAHALVL